MVSRTETKVEIRAKHVFYAKNRHWSRLRWDTSRCQRSEWDERNALIINTVTGFGPTCPTRPAQKQASCNASRCPAGEKESVFSTHLLLIGKPLAQVPTLSDLLCFERDEWDQRDGCFVFNDLRVSRGWDQSGTGGAILAGKYRIGPSSLNRFRREASHLRIESAGGVNP